MKDFTEMNLTLVSVDGFPAAGLYCLDDSILQDQDLFPGCYGICANPDVSGIGNRISLYIQTILTLWLATLTPHPDDTLGAMLAAIAASFTIFVATLASYAYNNMSFHHTLITINLSNLPTVAFFAGILRLRLQPGVIPMGPKIFATPILALQFIACAVSVFLGVGLNSIVGSSGGNSGRGGIGGWEVSQPQCNNETQVIIFGRSLQFWTTESIEDLQGISPSGRIGILVIYGIIVFLPFISSIVCLYFPETGTLRAFASAFHQTQRTNVFALAAFFVLSNAWVGILIYATELQIMRNKVLPGEALWGSGQILAMFLVLVPLLGCLKILFTEVGNRNRTARRWFKRMKLHKIFGIQYESSSAAPSAPGTPRRSLSRTGSVTKDMESGDVKGSSTPASLRAKSPSNDSKRPQATRRLSKRDRFEVPKLSENPIVSPGEDFFPEDYFEKRPNLSEQRQDTLVDNQWKDNKRKSTSGSIAGHSIQSITGNVKVIVKPDGQMSRVLSRRSSYAREREQEAASMRSRPQTPRRLSKSRPESRAEASSRLSRSEDGFESAREDMSRRSSVVGRSGRDYDGNDNDGATIKKRRSGQSGELREAEESPKERSPMMTPCPSIIGTPSEAGSSENRRETTLTNSKGSRPLHQAEPGQ